MRFVGVLMLVLIGVTFLLNPFDFKKDGLSPPYMKEELSPISNNLFHLEGEEEGLKEGTLSFEQLGIGKNLFDENSFFEVHKKEPSFGNSGAEVHFSIRPNNEFLMQLWEGDMDLQRSFRDIDLTRPPIQGEIIINY